MKELSKGDTVHVERCVDLETGQAVGRHFGCVEKKSGALAYLVRIFTHRHKGNQPADRARCKGRLKNLIDGDTWLTEPKFIAETENLKKIKGYYESET